MLLGFNYPWSGNRDGGQFGPNFNCDAPTWEKNNQLEAKGDLASIPLPHPFEQDHIDRNLTDLNRLGFTIVRWFILGNGNSYGLAPSPVPGVFTAGPQHTWNFTPPSVIDKRFRRDFTELLARFKKAGMYLIPSLINYEFGSDLKAGPGANGTGYGGRADVIRDPAKRKVFLDTMLAELLAASTSHKDQIYAWEVINEPIWLCRPYGALALNPPFQHTPEVTDDQMTEFLNDAIKRIEDSGFRSTVGHRYFADLGKFPTGGVPQFHYYAENPLHAFQAYPLPAPAVLRRPAGLRGGYSGYADPPQIRNQRLFSGNPKPILGEFDSARDIHGDPWPDPELRNNSHSTVARLSLLESEGCGLAMIFPDLSDKDPANKPFIDKDVIKLLNVTSAEIAAFTKGVLPPPDRQGP
jgi:hypothetical protein